MKITNFALATLIISFYTTSLIAQQKTNYKFSFGTREVPGYLKVDPSRVYSETTLYGFDFGTNPVAIDRNGKKPLTSGFCTSDEPFFFSVKIPEGNYDIKIRI